MIELTVSDGNPMAVNEAEIASVQAAGAGTLVVFASGATELVQESYLDVMAMLAESFVEPEASKD